MTAALFTLVITIWHADGPIQRDMQRTIGYTKAACEAAAQAWLRENTKRSTEAHCEPTERGESTARFTYHRRGQ